MNLEDTPKALLILFIVAVFLTGFFIGRALVTENIRNEAITAKVAHWIVDAQTGKTTFIWNTQENKDKVK